MMAFLSGPPLIPYNVPGRTARSVCSYRPPVPRPPRVFFSALIDESKPLSEPPRDLLTEPLHRDLPKESEPDSALPPEQRSVARPSRPTHSRDPRRFESPPRFTPDPNAVYYTKCAKCSAAYELDPLVLGNGRRVACSVCSNEWFQKPDRLFKMRETEQFSEYPMDRKAELLERNQQNRARGGRRRDTRDRRPTYTKTFSVFIGNLPYSVTEQELTELISSVVKPKRISIVTDQDGNSKGFAFADVQSEEEVDQIVRSLDATRIAGRTIAVRPGKKNS
ncbi:putative RNA-binding protein RbpE [Gracilariopsis chorda]|uniref:Putative RNA-binding protein RbpE n=1 Tax=Gracilariopsis chorda TaxID=448386 RepID=A0A2V3J103_9FLOR|nr:putative RNA-binding protein RbpE [Gracilariopsis chorda]|eukprot:PXF48064.1 putative RNA-binding protein RbpE [Gracilariopsis chorda]